MKCSVGHLTILFASAIAVFAQTNRGGISGTVFDQTGGVVSDATVIITNIGTSQTLRLKTSETGSYSASDLEPVRYRVEVELTGFKKAVVESVKIDTATTQTVNVTLEPGNVETQVSVKAEAPLMNTESGTTSQTISERMLTDIPLANRSVLDLAVVTPNVSGDVGSEDPSVNVSVPVPGFNLSVNGGRPGTSYMIADGVSNTGVGLAREVVSFSPETVQEFTVQTSAYSAAYGHTGGGVINVTTKSGTNEYHGAATVYHRNPATNASPWTNATVNRPQSNLRYTQMSFDLGGPVAIPKLYNGHNRTFFFAAVEPRYQGDSSQGNTLLPTDAMRNGDFSNLTAVTNGWAPTSVVSQFQSTLPPTVKLVTGEFSTIYQAYDLVQDSKGKAQLQQIVLGTNTGGCGAGFTVYCPFPGNVVPSSFIDPVAQKIFQLMPKAGPYYIDGNGNLANYVGIGFVHNDQVRYQVRLDHTISDRNRAFFRFTDVPGIGIRGGNGPLNTTESTYSFSHQYTVSDTQVISPRVYNDARFSYTYGRFSGTFAPEFDILSGRNLSTELGLPSLTKGGLPLFTFSAATTRRTTGADIGAGSSQINDNSEKQYQIVDNLYINRGPMTWTIGFELAQQSLDTIQYNFAAGGRYGFRYNQTSSNGGSGGTGGIVFASFLEGVINDNLLATALVPYSYRWRNAAAFVQNDWKVRPNLTLNLGLRYSLQVPRTEADNLQGYYVPAKAQAFPILDPGTGQPSPLTSINIVGSTQRLTLPTPITSALVPPFAYSGIAGNSKFQNPINWADFEPRFGFAYSPHLFGLNNFVVRGGYGVSHVPLTGQNRQPVPNFGGPGSVNQADPNFATRLSTNPPSVVQRTAQEAVGVTDAVGGLSYINSINLPGAILSSNTKTPYVQNWNLSVARTFRGNTVVELAYVGAKGTHLFLPQINTNLFDPSWVGYLEANGLNAFDTKVADPLGRCVPGRSPAAGQAICTGSAAVQVPIGTLYTPYLGFSNLVTFADAAADSLRHAGYISVVHRPAHGLTWSANYTYGKSIDNASNGSPDKNVLTSSNLPGGQITFGGTPQGDRAVSTFDVKHVLNGLFIYDLPFGQGRRFLANASGPIKEVVSDWTVSGVERFYSGFPAVVTQAFANDRGTTITHDIRPNIVPGVPVVNPLFDRKCPVGSLCQPYINPAAFEEAPIGQLGNAPRTLDGARGPWQQTLDLSVQKNFRITERWRVQLRMDAINALNHPIFRTVPNNFGGTDIWGGGGGGLKTGTLNTADYNSWAAANNQPTIPTTPGPNDPGTAILSQINATINAFRQPPPPNSLPGALGRLPADFFTVPLPQGFALMDATSFDIRTVSGYKLFRVRQDLGIGSGRLSVPLQSSRYLQFGLRIFF